MKFIVILTLFAFIGIVFGHSYVTTPITRSNQRATDTGCRYPSCGPCDSPTPAATRILAARGDPIILTWARNNHPGGFVRFAWTSTADSSSQSSFDAGVDSFHCFESPSSTSSTCHSLTGDPLGTDDGNQFNCGANITIPSWVPDGFYTLQWIWFGGIYYLGEYSSCIDYQISGGISYTGFIPTPIFHGGDAATSNSHQCQFANTNTPHTCGEPCSGPYPSGVPQLGAPNASFAFEDAPFTTGGFIFTSSAITTQQLTTLELTTQELTSQEITTQEIEITTSEGTTNSFTTSSVTTSYIPVTTSQLTTSSFPVGNCVLGATRCVTLGGSYQTCVQNYNAVTGTYENDWGCDQNCPCGTGCYQCSATSLVTCT